jgi:hypothetical protein
MNEAEILARITSLRGSTSEVDFPGLADHVGTLLIAAHERAAGAAQANVARTAAVEARIKAAIGVLPLDRGVVSIVRRRMECNPHEYGGVAGRRQIARVVESLKKCAPSDSDGSHLTTTAWSTHSST